MNYVILIILQCSKHRCLQSCVGTWARLGYAAFDAQLQKAFFVITRCAVRYRYVCGCVSTHLQYRCLCVADPRDMSMHGSKQGLQVPMVQSATCISLNLKFMHAVYIAASKFRPSKMALWSKNPNSHLLSSSNIIDRMSRTWPTIFMEGFLLKQLHRDVTQSLEQSTSREWVLGSNILRRINSSSRTCNEWLCERRTYVSLVPRLISSFQAWEEKRLVTLGGSNCWLPAAQTGRLQSDCRTKSRGCVTL